MAFLHSPKNQQLFVSHQYGKLIAVFQPPYRMAEILRRIWFSINMQLKSVQVDRFFHIGRFMN